MTDYSTKEISGVNLGDAFEYLDALRLSGVTNMYGAAPYIRQRFHCTTSVSYTILSEWMKTFGERHPI